MPAHPHPRALVLGTLLIALSALVGACDQSSVGASTQASVPAATNTATTLAGATSAIAPKPKPALPPTLADLWRPKIDLSGPGWKLWRDKTAAWEEDPLFIPPVDLTKVPTTQPTGGWDTMFKNPKALDVKVPGTTEEYLWGEDGDPHLTFGVCTGVSYWWRDLNIPATWQGKRLVLHFEAIRQRAEVYVNEQLVGYDIVGNTPFDADITKALRWDGQPNRLVVRITNPTKPPTRSDAVSPSDTPDPNIRNNFDWADYGVIRWGTKSVPSSHGFGGITGDVTLVATDPVVTVSDIFVMNKPKPTAEHPTDVDVSFEVENLAATEQKATLTLQIFPKNAKDPERKPIFKREFTDVALPPGKTTRKESISVPEALLWDLETPNLYECEVAVEVPGASRDADKVTFGFRWFAPDNVGGADAVLRLNGRRIMAIGSITWNYYPVSGMVPTEELVDRQIANAKALGLNMLFMHRNIAPRMVIEKAEEAGLLLYCEPGGYKCEGGDADAQAMAREKFLRMVRRDRNSPAVAIWGMINEIWVQQNIVHPRYLAEMAEAHRLDPTRTIVLCSGQYYWYNARNNIHSRSWMMPYDTQRRESGWYDEHRATGPGAYHDGLYRGPEACYALGQQLEFSDVIFWGEDGAISSPPLLDTLKKEYAQWGRKGWDGDDYLAWQKGYSDWLDAHHARKAFPTVDDLARSLGDVAYYYHGRVIEECRMTNKTDGYMINAWDCMKLDNHSGIVGPDRRLKGNPELIARYAKDPLYVAVMLRKMICEPGAQTTADFWIVNEKNVKGPHTLLVTVKGPGGKELFTHEYPVNVTGGETYGELLTQGVTINVGEASGYIKIEAELRSEGKTIAKGDDQAFVVDYKSAKIPPGGVVLDRRGAVKSFLDELKYNATEVTATTLDELKDPVPFIVTTHSAITSTAERLLRRVRDDGTTLIVLQNADRWAQVLADRGACKYEGRVEMRGGWVGGSFFATDHPILDDLPKSQGCNWEYQLIQTIHPSHAGAGRTALLLTGDEAAIGAYNCHDPKPATAVGVVKYGKGKVILSTVDIVWYLSSPEPAAAVPKKLLVNMLMYAGRK